VTATDELRRLLDERGVEHFDGCESTLWGYEQTSESTGAYRYSADEISGGFVNVWLYRLTPEQAVEATLGRGTCRNASDAADEGYFECSACGASCSVEWESGGWDAPRFCPNCGRRVVTQ